ncbi:MAG: hypothetical protein ACYC0P_05010 [Thiobacillus sp.]
MGSILLPAWLQRHHRIFDERDRTFFPALPNINPILARDFGMIDHARSSANARTPRNRGHAAPRAAGSDAYACPACGQHGLIRIRRRFIDRILNVFIRQRRFRCTQPGCQWQGNLRKRNTHPESETRNKDMRSTC